MLNNDDDSHHCNYCQDQLLPFRLNIYLNKSNANYYFSHVLISEAVQRCYDILEAEGKENFFGNVKCLDYLEEQILEALGILKQVSEK